MLYINKMSDEVVDAHQWFKDGDHPKDESKELTSGNMSEGKIVGFYRKIDDEDRVCPLCKKHMYDHGMLEDKPVCPGFWILTKEDGSYECCGDKFFNKLYKKV
jgi:hypothetical protein